MRKITLNQNAIFATIVAIKERKKDLNELRNELDHKRILVEMMMKDKIDKNIK